MAPEISKLKSLYHQLDKQQAAGEDVVAELKKEINNLELAYLKEHVLPQMAEYLAYKVCDLRCGIDCSFQFDGDHSINYSFCTSGVMIVVKDSLETNVIPYNAEALASHSKVTISPPNETKAKYDDTKRQIRLVDYSEKAIALYGNTKDLSIELKNLGGYFNPRLREGAGWIFSKKRKKAIVELLSPYLNDFNSPSTKLDNKLDKNISDKTTTYLESKLSKEEWINLILSMNCMKYKGFVAPHKAIFILTIINAIKNKKIIENRIFPSTSLSDIFNRIWCQYVPLDLPFKSNFFQPFIHMEGEPYYNLIRLEGKERFDINQNWNRKNVLQYVEYGFLDPELFEYLFDERFTSELQHRLIEKYLSQDNLFFTDTKGNNKEETQKGNKGVFKTFNRYLHTLKSNKGKPYSESSINVFIGALKSKYIIQKLTCISSYENLEAVNDLNIINKLLSLIFYDYENGSKNIVTYQALRLYRDYFKQNIKDNSIKGTLKNIQHNDYKIKSRENVVDSPVPNKIVEIKSIRSEDIFIEGYDSENIFVDFINQIGSNLVRQMNINYLGANIIDSKPNPYYQENCKLLSDGNWINVSARPKTLANHIMKICTNLNMLVEIEFKVGTRVIKIDNKNSIK